MHLTLRSTLAATALALTAAALATPAVAADASDEAFYQRAADCAAAMQVDQYALVARGRAGDSSVRPALFEITKLGFSYIGEASLKGLPIKRGEDMLKASTAAQKDWSNERHRAMVSECRVEAQKIYDNAGFWKMLVDNKANKRVDRFLSMAALPASTASVGN